MYEKILVTLDGSKESECIIDHVRMLAQSCGISKLAMIRVVEDMPPATRAYIGDQQSRDITKKAVAAAEEYLSYAADSLRTHCGGVDVVVLEGNPATKILEYAEKNGVDLIAMATHGASGITRFVIGSVTRHVMDHWSGALLTVAPPGCRP